MDQESIRRLDGPALAQAAFDLHLAPPHIRWREGYPPNLWDGTFAARPWEPWNDVAAATEVFQALRHRGWTTSCVWFGDLRQEGEAWVGCEGARAYRVRWPTDVGSEAMALTLVSVLAVVGESAPRPPHPDGSACTCVWSTAGWWLHHRQTPPELADAAEQLSQALGLDEETGA